MKLRIFSDLHGNFEDLKILQGLNNLFFLGDIFTNKGFVKLIGWDFIRFYKKILTEDKFCDKFFKIKNDLSKCETNNEIPNFFKENEIYILPGNHETKKYYGSIKKLSNLHDLHLKKIKIGNIEFGGHGGIISPNIKIISDNFFIYPDEIVARNLRNMKLSEECIILMHELPIGDYCKETRSAIESIKPRLVIGGHNHRPSEKSIIINDIKYIYCGMKGGFSEIDI